MQPAPASPVTGSPRRVAGSVRRTSHIDMRFPDDEVVMLRLCGGARDLRDGEVTSEATIDAGVGFDRRILSLEVQPSEDKTAVFVGTPAGSGFRGLLDRELPEQRGTTLGLLLDEVPVATLISGYASLRSTALAARVGHDVATRAENAPALIARMSDMCSGWRADGTAMGQIAAGGEMQLQDCPPAPSLYGDDPLAWHGQPDLERGAMRRRRRIDLKIDEHAWIVDAMFRDTYGEDDGVESVLHEYSVQATFEHGAVMTITAEPHVLPFPECPSAAVNVGRLVGVRADRLRDVVRTELAGVAGCTHLNDLLRALADVPELAELARKEF